MEHYSYSVFIASQPIFYKTLQCMSSLDYLIYLLNYIRVFFVSFSYKNYTQESIF